MSETSRRDLLRMTGGALWVGLASACGAGTQRATTPGAGTGSAASDAGGFLMFQLTDTHWGYKGAANPEAGAAFERAVAEVAKWPTKPELVVHTGDVTHMTSDAAERQTTFEARDLERRRVIAEAERDAAERAAAAAPMRASVGHRVRWVGHLLAGRRRGATRTGL